MIVARNMDVQHRTLKTVEGLPFRGEAGIKTLMQGNLMSMLEIHYPAGVGSPLHAHTHESLCYVVKGQVKVVVGEETFTLGAGDACRHPEGVPHRIEGVEDSMIVEIKAPAQHLDQFLGTTQ